MSSLNYMELCRLCLVKDRVQIPIFEGEGDIRQIFLKIAACLPVKVKKDDKLPKKICDDCMYKVEMLYQFWNTTANAEKQLLEWLGEAVEEKKTNNDTHVKQESMEQDPGSELAKSLSRVEAVLAEAREAESDNDNFAGSNKAETDSDDEPLSSLEPTTFVNVGLNGSGTNESNTQGEFLAPGAPSTSKTNSTNAQMAASGLSELMSESNFLLVRNSSNDSVLEMLNLAMDDKNDIGTSHVDKSVVKIKTEMTRKFFPSAVNKVVEGSGLEDTNKLTCKDCGKKFRTKRNLSRHFVSHSSLRPFACDICFKTFKRSHERSNHKKIHADERQFKCDICSASFVVPYQLKIHINRHFSAYRLKCDLCEKGFHTMSELKSHRNIHHDAHEYSCIICCKTFASNTGLLKHLETHDPSFITQKHKCNVCNKIFSAKSSLSKHYKSHRGEDIFVCDICGQKLKGRSSLTTHIKSHTNIKPIECSVCRKRFSKKFNLSVHQLTHSGIKPYVCDKCGRRFSQRSTLVVHQRYHSGARPYICEFCGKGFVSRTILNNHVRVAHDSKLS